MLAQSFKTADELDISQPQLEALQKTLVLLETGKLTYVQPSDTSLSYLGPNPVFTGHFNMEFWANTIAECGTVACIGGTAEMIGQVSFDGYGPALDRLFYPHGCNYSNITIDQAARALRNYLTTGEASWAEVRR